MQFCDVCCAVCGAVLGAVSNAVLSPCTRSHVTILFVGATVDTCCGAVLGVVLGAVLDGIIQCWV